MADLVLLCVHPHPDDESIACGGVIARYAEEGMRVAVVTCTRGESGEVLSGLDIGERDLADVRELELAEALRRLGVADHEYLGYRDSGMAGTADNDDPRSFHVSSVEEAASRLAAIIRRLRPDVVVSDPSDGTYGHPDHVKSYLVTTRAVELAADPSALPDGDAAWQVRKRYVHTLPKSALMRAHNDLLEHGVVSPFGSEPVTSTDQLPFGTPDEIVTTSIDVRPWLTRKRDAMAAHESQIGPDSFFLSIPEGLGADTFGWEYYVRLSGPGRTDPHEDDLFDGLRG